MDRNNQVIIKPTIEEPFAIEKIILYPHFVSEVMVSIPRAIGRPRRFKLFLLVDGCTGKVLRCDSWPELQTAESAYESVSINIQSEEAKQFIKDYAKKKIALRHMTYWQSGIDIIRFREVYKMFWMLDAKSAIDSLSARRLVFT